jgi:hypothetical protein
MNETGPIASRPRLPGPHQHRGVDPTNTPGENAGSSSDPLAAFEQSFEKSFMEGFEKGFEQALKQHQSSGGADGGNWQEQQPWSTTYQNGQPTVDLGNYTLDLNKNNSQWTLTNKATGAKTNVWGDPHVDENGTSWTFKNNTTFQLDDGTKISVKTVPYGNGMTLSSELDITQGGRGMKITGLEQNDAGDALKIQDGLNGYALQASNAGNNMVFESGNTWLNGAASVITADVANKDNL